MISKPPWPTDDDRVEEATVATSAGDDDEKKADDSSKSKFLHPKASKGTAFTSSLLLSDEEILALGVAEEGVACYRQQKFREAFTLEKWLSIDALKEHSFDTVFVTLSPNEVRALCAFFSYTTHKDTFKTGDTRTDEELKKQMESSVTLRHAMGKWFADEETNRTLIAGVKQRIDEAVDAKHWRTDGFFAKFNSRSPKDVFNYSGDNAQLRKHFFEELRSVMLADGGREDPALATANDALWAWYAFGAKLLRMTCGEDVIKTFSHSYRALEDLQAVLRLQDDRFVSISLALRQWWTQVPSEPFGEYRAFVHNKSLNAVTQYMSMIRFPQLQSLEIQATVKERIVAFYESVKDLIPLDSFVIDFLVLDLCTDSEELRAAPRTLIIELNPFYTKAGSGLFSWKTDRELFLNGPLEFRFATEPDADGIELLHASWRRALADFKAGKRFDDITPRKTKAAAVASATASVESDDSKSSKCSLM